MRNRDPFVVTEYACRIHEIPVRDRSISTTELATQVSYFSVQVGNVRLRGTLIGLGARVGNLPLCGTLIGLGARFGGVPPRRNPIHCDQGRHLLTSGLQLNGYFVRDNPS